MQAFFSAVDAATDVTALWRALISFLHEEGVGRVIYVHIPPPGLPDHDMDHVRIEGYPPEWVDRHIIDGPPGDDPVRAEARIRAAPFRLSEIRAVRTLTPAQAAYLDEFEEVNNGEGIAIPVFGPNGRNGYVGLAFPPGQGDPPADLLHRLRIAAQYAHQRYCALVRGSLDGQPPLSPRELEVLGWVARGKSNSAIAGILGVSSNTIDTHLRRIYAKLHVSDRVSAALAGLGHGLIDIS